MYFVLYLFLYHSGTSIEVPEKKQKKNARGNKPLASALLTIVYLLNYFSCFYIPHKLYTVVVVVLVYQLRHL